MSAAWRFCPVCAAPLVAREMDDDGGSRLRMACGACAFVHWNNPTPVLAAIVEYQGRVLLARNAAWQEPVFALITGFMEAGETPEEGVKREIAEETNLHTTALELVAVHDYQRMNQVIISYHAVCEGEVRLSPELAEYRLFALDEVKCWPAGTGWALAQWLRARGVEPQWRELRKA